MSTYSNFRPNAYGNLHYYNIRKNGDVWKKHNILGNEFCTSMQKYKVFFFLKGGDYFAFTDSGSYFNGKKWSIRKKGEKQNIKIVPVEQTKINVAKELLKLEKGEN